MVVLFASGQAAVIPGRWDKVETLPPGRVVAVTLKEGGRIEGVLKGTSGGDLLVARPEGRELRIAKSDVQRVTSPEPAGDGLLNGTLLGLAAGLALGGMVIVSDSAGAIAAAPGGSPTFTGGFHTESEGLGSKVAVLGGAAAVGAVFGLLIDASKEDSVVTHDVLYRAQ